MELKQESDIQIRIVQSLSDWLFEMVTSGYTSSKEYSKIINIFASGAEGLLGKTGIFYIAKLIFNQWQKYGGPLVEKVDKKLGDEIIQLFVRIMLQAGKEVSVDEENAVASYKERVQFLLRGDTVCVQSKHEKQLEEEVKESYRMNEAYLRDIERLEIETRDQKQDLFALQKEKSKLEQELTDVHNYTASERGQQYQHLENEHAQLKLKYVEEKARIKELERIVKKLKKENKREMKLAVQTPPKSVPLQDNNPVHSGFFTTTP